MSKVSAKNGVIVIGGYVLSSFASEYNTETGVEPLDGTGFGDGWQNFIGGQYKGQMALNMYFDNAAGSANAALQGLGSKCVTIMPEGYVLGNHVLTMEAVQGNWNIAPAASGILQAASVPFLTNNPDGGPWPGWALAHATITATATGTGFIDPSGGQVTARCGGILHVWDATATDTYVIKIQHSASLGSGYADLVTFVALNGTALGSEHVVVASGAIEKYRRVVATRTGVAADTLGYTVSFWHS